MAKVWMPDYPPASASAYDDEFDDESVNDMWTEWDVPNTLTVSEGAYGLSLLQSSSAAISMSGIYQALPAGDFTIWTKVSFSRLTADTSIVGIMLGEDLANNPSTSNVIDLTIYQAVAEQVVRALCFSAYNGSLVGDVYGTVTDVVIGTGAYLRIRRATTTLYFDYSSNGIAWQQIATVAQPFTPGEMGLFVDNRNTGANIRAVFSFFRYAAGTPALTDINNGRRVM